MLAVFPNGFVSPIMPGLSPIAPADESGSWVFVDALFVRNCREWVGFEPQRTSSDRRINASFVPPYRLITRAVELAMMPPAQRNRKLIACLTAQRPVLGEA